MNFRLLLLNILLLSTFVFAQNRKVYVDSLFSWDGSGTTISDYNYGIQTKDVADSSITSAKIASAVYDSMHYKIEPTNYTLSNGDSILISQGLYNIVKNKKMVSIVDLGVANDSTLNQGDELNLALKYCAEHNYTAFVPPGKYHLQVGYHFSLYQNLSIIGVPGQSLFYSEGAGFIANRDFGGKTSDSENNNYYIYGITIIGPYGFDDAWAAGNSGIYINKTNDDVADEKINVAWIEKCEVRGVRSEAIRITGAREAYIIDNIVRDTPFSAYTFANDNTWFIGNVCEYVFNGCESYIQENWNDEWSGKAIVKDNVFNVGNGYGLRTGSGGTYIIEGNYFAGHDTLLNWSETKYTTNGIEMVMQSTNAVNNIDTSFNSIIIRGNDFSHLSRAILYYDHSNYVHLNYLDIKNNIFGNTRSQVISLQADADSLGTSSKSINHINIQGNTFKNWSTDITGTSGYQSGVAISIANMDSVVAKDNTFWRDRYSNGRYDPITVVRYKYFIFTNNPCYYPSSSTGRVNVDSTSYTDYRQGTFVYNNPGLPALGVRLLTDGFVNIESKYQSWNTLYNGFQIGMLKIIINESVANDSTFFIIGTDSVNAKTALGL